MSDSVSISNGVAVGKDVKAPDKPDDRAPKWWLMDATKDNGRKVADGIRDVVKRLKELQEGRTTQCVIGARLYGNAPLGLMGTRAVLSPQTMAARAEVKDNVAQSIVDTSTATIGENKPRPYFLTDGGDYKLQRQAKKLTQFSDGIFYEQSAYDIGSEAQRDCEIFGDGWVYVGVEFGRIVYQRALSTELWCDELEGAMTLPRQLHWERPVDRDKLIALCPEKAEQLRGVQRSDPKEFGGRDGVSDMVTRRISWHLRGGPDEKRPTGLCVVSVDGLVLDSYPWDEDWYPFARWIWTPRTSGFWSQGLCEQLQSSQIEVNKLDRFIQQSMHRAGTYKVFLEAGSKVVKEHVSNEIGAIITYRGTKPIYEAPPAVHPDWFTRRDALVNNMYERAGISRLTATGEKPAGLNSGEAQRVYRDSVAQRMKTQERLNERGFMDLAKISIATARQIALKTGKPYEVRAQKRRSLRTLSLTADELNPKDWRTQCFPTSSLPKDPAGRLAAIQERIQAGMLSMSEGKRLLDYPDLEAEETLANVADDLLTSILDDIVDGEGYRPPEPTDNLARAKELCVEYINFGRLHGLGPEEMDLLQTWNEQVDALMQMAMPPPMPGAPPGATPGGGPPEAQGAPPPVSNLLPFGQRAA